MTRTSFLTAMIVVVLLMHYFPAHAAAISSLAIAIAVLYLAVFALRKYPRLLRERKRLAAEAAADEKEYWEYKAELDSLRAKFKRQNDADDSTSGTPSYQAELDDLHARHQPMLDRRFGGHAAPLSSS